MPALRNLILPTVYAVLMAVPAAADTVPPTIRACIGEADAARRLACYDREVARLIAPADTFAPVAAAAPAAPLPAPTSPAVVSTAPAAAIASSQGAAAAPGPARHYSAKVSAVHQAGDELTVTLDNGEVWQQASAATSQLNLRPGDVVKMDREAGTWFLSNRYGDTIQVKLRQP
jgi:hypothetical protein